MPKHGFCWHQCRSRSIPKLPSNLIHRIAQRASQHCAQHTLCSTTDPIGIRACCVHTIFLLPCLYTMPCVLYRYCYIDH